MLRFDANLTIMYGNLPLLDAMAAAREDGFDAVECRTPFEHSAEVVRERLDALGLTLVQFNCPMGDFPAGDRGLACVPGREEEFRDSIALTIGYARALGVGQVNCVAGRMPEGATLAEVEDVFAANLRYAAPRLADAGVRLQIEPVNALDNPDAYLTTTDRYARIAERVAHDNLYLQFDFYHIQISQGDLLRRFDTFADRISHVQIADNPGRHEPGTGEIAYPFLFDALAARGYDRWIGCEYVPRTTAGAGLRWLTDYQTAYKRG